MLQQRKLLIVTESLFLPPLNLQLPTTHLNSSPSDVWNTGLLGLSIHLDEQFLSIEDILEFVSSDAWSNSSLYISLIIGYIANSRINKPIRNLKFVKSREPLKSMEDQRLSLQRHDYPCYLVFWKSQAWFALIMLYIC